MIFFLLPFVKPRSTLIAGKAFPGRAQSGDLWEPGSGGSRAPGRAGPPPGCWTVGGRPGCWRDLPHTLRRRETRRNPRPPSLRSFSRALGEGALCGGRVLRRAPGDSHAGDSRSTACARLAPRRRREADAVPIQALGGLRGPAPQSPGGRGGPGALVHHVVVIIAQPQLHVFETRPLLHPAKGRPVTVCPARPSRDRCLWPRPPGPSPTAVRLPGTL